MIKLMTLTMLSCKGQNKNSDNKPQFINYDFNVWNEFIAKKEDFKLFNYESPCNIKEGYLARAVLDRDTKFVLVPIFTVVNRATVTFFKNPEPYSLVTSIELDEINEIEDFDIIENGFCMKVIFNNKKFYILCPGDHEEKKKWVNAFKNYKNCEVKY